MPRRIESLVVEDAMQQSQKRASNVPELKEVATPEHEAAEYRFSRSNEFSHTPGCF